MSQSVMNIAGRFIGDGYSPYIVAEISANHGGTLQTMLKSIKVAKQCGADAVKIQVYSPESLTINCDNEHFKITKGLWKGKTLYELYLQARTPYAWLPDIFKFGRDNNITIFGTPFSETDAARLYEFQAPAYKVASFEINDIEFIKKIAACRKPIILSTGMASTNEVKDAYFAAKSQGVEVALLHCISAYPAEFVDMNISRVKLLKERFPYAVIGLSDHSHSSIAACMAIACGASIIEKHFILDPDFESPDKEFSLLPDEFTEFVCDCRSAFYAMGRATDHNKSMPDEAKNRQFRRSIFVVKDMGENEYFTRSNIQIIRPGSGMSPKYYENMVGKVATKAIKRGTPLSDDLVK